MATSAKSIAVATLEQLVKSPSMSGDQCRALAQQALDSIKAMTNKIVSSKSVTLLADAEPVRLDTPIDVYTDGGCHGNPGPAGWGAVVVQSGGVVREANGYIGVQTNNIAELTAAIEGLSLTPEGATVTLISDSQYTLNGLTSWRKGWERRGFVNASNQPVANKEYWLKLYALADARKVQVQWVRGHTGNPYNERCDQLATAAIKSNS